MAIEGPLKELGIHDVFQLLDLNRKTGVLRVTSNLRQNRGAVWFTDGAVVYAEIHDNRHRLGDLLVRAAKITEADLDRARSMQRQGDQRRIGELLVLIGAITNEELERHVRFQTEEVIFEMIGWQEGYFSFEEDRPEVVAPVPGDAVTNIRIESLLMEGARRIDEWSRMERTIPHVGVIPCLAPPGDERQNTIDLRPGEWEILAAIDSVRDIRAIATSLALSEFDVAKTVFGLEAGGIVTILEPAARARPVDRKQDIDEILARIGEALDGGDLDGARAIIDAGLGSFPHDPRLYVSLGQANLAAGRFHAAEEGFRRALRLDTLQDSAHRLLGNALARQGKITEAVGWWTRWLKLQEQGGTSTEAEEVKKVLTAAETLESYLQDDHE